jgi:hypothetical protein
MWIVGALAIALGFLLVRAHHYHTRRQQMSDREVADLLERHLDGTARGWEWANFTDSSFRDAHLEGIRKRSIQFDLLLTDEKRRALRELIDDLRKIRPKEG